MLQTRVFFLNLFSHTSLLADVIISVMCMYICLMEVFSFDVAHFIAYAFLKMTCHIKKPHHVRLQRCVCSVQVDVIGMLLSTRS